jgi:hypothetical protein
MTWEPLKAIFGSLLGLGYTLLVLLDLLMIKQYGGVYIYENNVLILNIEIVLFFALIFFWVDRVRLSLKT